MKKYKDLKIDDLRDICTDRGLDTSGKKSDLISRLLKSDTEKSGTSDMFTKTAENEPEIKLTRTDKEISSNAFYLQIKSSNLSNYFNFGFFYPLALEESEIYKNENRAKDILSFFEDYIILGQTPFNQFENTDVLIEFVLDGIKPTEFERSGLYYVGEPIPISRVKSIYFKSVVARENFISSIKTFPDSFIASSICKIVSIKNEKPTKIDLDQIKLPKNENLFNWKDKLDLFDKILGLFAFVKNVGVFYAERENKFEDYTHGFFSTLNLINPIKQLNAYKENTFLKPLIHYRNLEISNLQRIIFKSAIERVYANKSFDIKTAIEILESSITNDSKNGELTDIKAQIELFKQLDKLTTSFKGLLQNDVLKKNLPALALLFLSKFPNKSRQNSDKQAVRNSFIDGEFGFTINVSEYILGFLGLYYGYKNMIKEDTNLKFYDKTFEQFSSSTQSIKFKLEGYLDRFIVESVFQFAVKQTILNDSFEFLNWDKEQNEDKLFSVASSFQYEYSDRSYTLLGQRILNIQRQDKTEKIFEKVESQYPNTVEHSTYLAAFAEKYLHLEKSHLLDLLKKNKGRYPMDELEKVIDLDKQSKKR
jgi:hypothetical protein